MCSLSSTLVFAKSSAMKLIRFSFIALAFSFVTASAYSQCFSVDDVPLINGYNKTISGEVIPYFSLYRKYAKDALLTRATDGKKVIEWQTDTIPKNTEGDYAYFTWIAAHSSATSSGVRHFDMYINDEYALTYSTYPQQYPASETAHGKDSTCFLFQLKTKDGANDSHGMAYLRVPLKKYKPGSVLKIKVVGQNQSSNDWYMTFRYAFKEKIEIAALPFLLRNGKQPLQITVLHFGLPGKLDVRINEGLQRTFDVRNGFNTFEMQVNAAQQKQNIRVTAGVGDILQVKEDIELRPITFREINFIHHSHTDIGYSHIQEEVIDIHNNNIRNALQLIERTKDYPVESRFTWNIESSWVVENFLKEATPEEKHNFIAAVKNGRILISALYANVMTGLSMREELDWISGYSISLQDSLKLPIRTAMMTDVPGMSWSVVESLAKRGIRYFSNGMNYIPGMPGNGDRIGHSLEALGDKPFWWKSPSGKDSILLWCAGKGYSSWHGTAAGAVFEMGTDKIAEYLNQLDKENYPYAMLQWRYNIVADNGPTDSTIADYVKQWNEKYASPKIILANATDMFVRFEKLYGNKIPVLSGDFTPYWEDGAYSTAREESQNRQVAQKIIALEQMAAQHKIPLPKEMLYRAKQQVLLFHEHTWGAHNSISAPDLPFVKHQWDYKKRYGDSAVYFTDLLEKTLLQHFKPSNNIRVINTLPFSRDIYVEMNTPPGFDGNMLEDENGKKTWVQQLSNGKMCFVVNDIPAGGLRMYSQVKPVIKAAVHQASIDFSTNEKVGAIDELETHKIQWADTTVFKGLMQALYVNGLDPAAYSTTKVLNAAWIEKGRVVNTMQMKCAMEGSREVIYTISKYDKLDYLKVSVTIDKLPVRDKESVHIALPFMIDDAIVRFGVGDGVYGPGYHQIAGANKDYFYAQRWLNVANDNRNVTISSPQAALFEVGEMINEKKLLNGYKQWKDSASSSPRIFLYAMNNYWHTNFMASQQGPVTFDVYLKFSEGKFNKQAADKFGYESTTPVFVIPPRE